MSNFVYNSNRYEQDQAQESLHVVMEMLTDAQVVSVLDELRSLAQHVGYSDNLFKEDTGYAILPEEVVMEELDEFFDARTQEWIPALN